MLGTSEILTPTLIKDARLVTEKGITCGDLLIKDGLIADMKPGIDSEGITTIEADGKFLLPGFVDIHNHGAAGFDFSFGKYNSNTGSFENDKTNFHTGLARALDFYTNNGCTSVLLTTMAAPIETLKKSMTFLNDFLEMQPQYNSRVAGINLEGTFIKDPRFAGAQNPDYFFDLDEKLIDELKVASHDRLKIINIPPEHGTRALPIIADLTAKGIAVAGGHSAAYADEFDAAVESGLSLAVHFLNGPSRSSTKSFQGGGAVESILRSDKIRVEIIADGYHVGKDHVRDIIACKELERVVIITDSMFATGMESLRSFDLLGLKGKVSQNRQYLQQVGKDSLFGSVLTMKKAFENMLTWLTTEMKGVWYRHHRGHDFDSAITAVSRMCSGNPANILGIDHASPSDPGTGSLTVGKRADLILASCTMEGEKTSLEIEKVWSSGKEITLR